MKKKLTTSIIAIVLALAPSLFGNTDTPETARLKARDSEFVPHIIKVAENVYVASGYDASNVSMIVGKKSVVIIDTAKDPEHAAVIRGELEKFSTRPIAGIIFTHSHGDHTGGVSAFLKGCKPQVWSRENYNSENAMAKAVCLKNPRAYR